VKQRELDSKRLLQRNRNVLAVLEQRQAQEEQRRTAEIRAQLQPPRMSADKLRMLQEKIGATMGVAVSSPGVAGDKHMKGTLDSGVMGMGAGGAGACAGAGAGGMRSPSLASRLVAQQQQGSGGGGASRREKR
jgi:hypothetical protein